MANKKKKKKKYYDLLQVHELNVLKINHVNPLSIVRRKQWKKSESKVSLISISCFLLLLLLAPNIGRI